MKKLKFTVIFSLILIFMFSISALASSVGVVNTDVLNFRSGPGTSYELVGQFVKGQVVQIVEHINSEWSKVSFNNKVGYIATKYIDIRSDETTSRSISSSGVLINQDGYVTSGLNFRAQPSFDSSVITTLAVNTSIRVLEDVGYGWGKVQYNDQVGYASLEYIKLGAAPAPVYESKADELIEYAKKFLGKPYVYGGNGPNSFDCSGFAKYIFANFGITLTRTTYDQVTQGYYVTKGELAKGDLIFFKQGRSRSVDHVGIYIGNGQFIHASSPGDVVKIDTISSGYYSNYYYTARRVLY